MVGSWRILLVEDHPTVVKGVGRILEPYCDTVSVAATVAAARTQLSTNEPFDAAIVDLHLPDGLGIELLDALSARRIHAIVLTGSVNPTTIRAAMGAGALGFVAKMASPATLVDAVRHTVMGEKFLCEYAQSVLADEADVDLSPREAMVLALVGAGRTNKEIAQQLGIAARTVETHRERVMRKVDAHNTADLTREAMRRGLLRAG